MRKIKFRGKRVDNGEWVEGLLTIMWGQYHIIKPSDENTAYSIDETTVCQYTGLTDKNGVEIYESDIVEIAGEDGSFVIEWDEDEARCVMDNEEEGVTVNFSNYRGNEVEVVGNVWDSLELLEAVE